MMLQIAPTHWFSWDVTVRDESRHVADLTTSWWREKGGVGSNNFFWFDLKLNPTKSSVTILDHGRGNCLKSG